MKDDTQYLKFYNLVKALLRLVIALDDAGVSL